MKCKHCDNEAVYTIDVDGETVHVCEDCDEDYSICCVCESEPVYMDTRCKECIAQEAAQCS
jgi:hypothetical protein